jgi:hypothetical protein
MSQLVKTKRQVNFKDFRRFGVFKGLVEQKTLYSTRSCVNFAFFGTRGPLKLVPKKTNLHTNHPLGLDLDKWGDSGGSGGGFEVKVKKNSLYFCSTCGFH